MSNEDTTANNEDNAIWKDEWDDPNQRTGRKTTKTSRKRVSSAVTANKRMISIRVDNDVLDWFKTRSRDLAGGQYQAMINAVLRRYMDENPRREPGGAG